MVRSIRLVVTLAGCAFLGSSASWAAEDGGTRAWTALHTAAAAGNVSDTAALLDHGADPNAAAPIDMTPLHLAAMRGRGEVAGLLLRRGARVDARNAYGMTPLHLAADGKVVEVLLGAGARTDAPDARGMTPLHTARHGDVARALLQKGADFRIADSLGRRPLDMAVVEALEKDGLVFYGLRAPGRLRGQEGAMALGAMNISDGPITDLSLEATSTLCTAVIAPGKASLRPGEMVGFGVLLKRRSGAPEAEMPLTFTATVAGRKLGNFDLMVDTRSGVTPEDQGMIRIGKATLRKAPSRWQYAAYAGAPLLVVLAWLVWRRR